MHTGEEDKAIGALRLLVIDDSEPDAWLIVRELERGGYELTWERVCDLAALAAALQRGAWDAVTCEWRLLQCDWRSVLAVIEEQGVDLSVTIVSGQVSEEVGVAAIGSGVNDFVCKAGLARLRPAVERELCAAAARRAAKESRDYQRLTNEIATQLGDGLYLIKTSDQTIAFTNPRFDQIFGYDAGELVGKHVSVVNAPTDRAPEDIATEIAETLAVDKMWHGEVCNRRKDGSYFWCSASVSTFEHAEFGPVWLAVHRDITDRKQAEELLRESEQRYRSLVTATTQMVWTMNPQGKVVGDCPSWRAYTGQTKREIQGRGWMKALHPGDASRVRVGWDAAVELGCVYEGEYRVRGRNGDYRDFAARGVPVVVEDGSIREWVAACTDITELRRAREALRAHQAELAHVLRVNTMGAMAAELAHEINQPLSAIANYAQGCRKLLASRSTAPDELLPALDEITTQTLRAGGIIRRLRQLVDKRETPYEDADLNEVVATAAQVLSAQARQLGIRIQTELSAEIPRVKIDQVQIEQVILNLMLNAIEAMQAANREQPELLVRTARSGNGAIELSVEDRGTGLSPATADRMFEPFYTSKPAGLGMGLSISRAIVERHGGRLRAANNRDGGATFYVELPLASRTPAPSGN